MSACVRKRDPAARHEMLLLKVLVAAALLSQMLFSVVANHTTSVIDPETMTSCLLRSYTFNVTGRYCWEVLEVDACWGRCDSWEVGVPSPPYVEFSHPVCTYTERVVRKVRLTNCIDGHEYENEELFDAMDCQCQTCSGVDAHCELY